MRFASDGPMRGNRSSASAGAVSRSIGVEVVEVIEDVEAIDVTSGRSLAALDDLDTFATVRFRAESTSSIWRWSAGWDVGRGSPARRKRTPAPRRATAAKKSSA